MSTVEQKALFLNSKCGQFAVGNRDIPKPASGELLVKVLAAALNPVDWKIQKHGIFVDTYPAILGTDVAGDVVQVGEGVTNFVKGDRVFFQGTFENNGAGFQQYTLSTAATTAKIPHGLTYDDVSTIPVALTAVYVGFYNTEPYGSGLVPLVEESGPGKYSGIPLVILGGSSSVGQYAIQLAKASGFSPIITTASLKHAEHLKALGATNIIDRRLPFASLQEEINRVTNIPIKYVYDAISSKETQQIGHDILTTGGELVVVLNPTVAKADNVTITHVVGVLRLPHNQVLLKGMYSKLTEWVQEGVIRPNRYEVISGGLHGILEGLKRLENDQVSGVKLVIHPWET